MSTFRINQDEPVGMPSRIDVRAIENELATTRRSHRLEAEARAFAQARNEVQDRYVISLPILRDHDEYGKLAAKHLEIGTRRGKLDREHSETLTAIARGIAAFNSNKIEHQAQSLIDGVSDEVAHGFEEMKSRAARLSDEVESHSLALQMLRTQMEEIRSERSIDVTEIVRPAHIQAAGAVAAACAALLGALRDERMIRELVKNAGYDDRLPGFQGIHNLTELERRAREYAQ